MGHLTRRGLYLAFHNPGACVALVSVRVFYQRCPEAVHGLAQFPDTLPGPGGLVEVAGTCLPHAHASPSTLGAPRMHCSPDGEWLVPVGRCHCEPGYEEGDEGCLGKQTRVGGDHLQGPLGVGTVSGVPREERKPRLHLRDYETECLRTPGRHVEGCFWYKGWEGAILPINILNSHGSAAFSLQPARAAPTGRTWTHPTVSSAPNTAQQNPRGPPSVPVRAAITEPPGRAPRRHAHVSPEAGSVGPLLSPC